MSHYAVLLHFHSCSGNFEENETLTPRGVKIASAFGKSSAVFCPIPLIEWLGRNTGVIKQSLWKTEIRMAVGTSPRNNVEIYVQCRELQLAK